MRSTFRSRTKATHSSSRPGGTLSANASPTRLRLPFIPAAESASAPACGKSYMSATQVVPPAIISIAPQVMPAAMSSGVIFASTGKIASSSQR